MKLPIKVIITDAEIWVSFAFGQWIIHKNDNAWLWVLNGIADNSEAYFEIQDNRDFRGNHQPDITGTYYK